MSLHIGANKGDIAEIVLLPGDPLRAKFIADNFLKDSTCYTTVRNMYGYTGSYKGLRVSVQGTGMGIPSISIYAHELIHEYGVKTVIRLGTCGSIHHDITLKDVILAMSASTDSNINRLKFSGKDYAPSANFELLSRAHSVANELAMNVHVGGIFSTDSFYGDEERYKIWAKHGILGVEMETSALYTIAAENNINALSICTVSDDLITNEFLPPEERDKQVRDMTMIALETVYALSS